MSLLFLFVSLRLLQLQSKGNWLGQQRMIFMLKPQELKPKSSAVTFCQETCRCFSFSSQNTYPLLFLTFDVNSMTMVTFDSVSAFVRRSFFLSVGVCLALTSEALHGICNPLWIWIRILFQNCWTVCYSSLSVCLLYGEGTGWAKKGGGQTANKC